MKRRQFVKTLGAGTLLGGSVFSGAGAAAEQRFNWKLVTTWPPNFPVFQDGVERFAKDVRRMSDGRLNIQVFAGGELVPPLQSFEAVSQGTVEMGHGAAYYWAGKIPAAQFFTAVPFGLNAQGMNAWLYSGGGLKLWREVYEPFGLTPFPMGNTGVQMGGWFRKPIKSLADLKGLKMRIPGLGGKVMAKAGVNPVLLAGGEIFTALDRGTIDATEWVGPYHDLRLGLYRAAKHYYYPGWHEPGPVLELIINSKAWEGLPRELQLTIETATAASNLWMLSEFEARNLEALRTLQEKYHVEVLEFPSDVLAALREFADVVLDEQAAKDEVFRRVRDAYRAFQADNAAWNAVSETAYARSLRKIKAGML
ncbi:MAG: TRAP dicarboxylate transporter subunit DctP [Gammaproteobacteria bacterium]|nr:MAG: TRAP dicarboxylate transporter subunit DctP [Gammaproteobacteria bacterium]TND05483.1 MAG: TRAP dicarboxylate transporter subunit DctP [Gammaproteobacteria bacterium]